MSRRLTGPQFQQLQLPGTEDGPDDEQMRLFETHRAGPGSLYALNPSPDASEWRDVDREVPLEEDEREILEEEGDINRGEFYNFYSPAHSQEREFLANQGAFGRSREAFEQAGTYLGEEKFPDQPRPDLQFRDIYSDEGYGERTWSTDEGTEVGKVSYHDDAWGPYVETAEINPLYRGRGFSREAITEFAGGLEPEEGVVHAGSYTPAGAGAFHAKGIPTVRDIETAFESHIRDTLDEEQVTELARENRPDLPWDTEDSATLSRNERWAMDDVIETTRDRLTQDMYSDDYAQEEFRDHLYDMQEQVLSRLSESRVGSFLSGWKPEAKRGVQEKLFPTFDLAEF